jgi:hypothetical protein
MDNQTAYNILVFDELTDVLNSFKTEEIDTIVLKGAALAETVYGNIGQRKISDVDILVKERDLNKARDILSALGYKMKFGSQLFYTKNDSFPMAIDLHRNIWELIDNSTRKKIDMVWEDAIPADIAGVKTLIMSPEDSLIYSAVHMAVFHGCIMDKWIEDIKAIIKVYSETIDWEKFVCRSREYEIDIPLYYIFQNLLDKGLEIPGYVLKGLKPRKNNIIFKSLVAHVFSNKNTRSMDYLFPILVRKGFANRIKLILSYFFPSKEFLIKRYDITNEGLAYLFYFIRPLFLISKGLDALGSIVWNKIAAS